MRFLAVISICLIALPVEAIAAEPQDAPAQSGSVLVNGELISPEDIVQRTLLMNLSNHLGDRVKVLVGSDEVQQTYRERMRAANPHSQAEAQAAALRIKGELMAAVRKRALLEGGVTRKQAVDALVLDRLKLQAAKRLGIEVSGEEAGRLAAERLAPGAGAGKADVDGRFALLEEVGIYRKTVLDRFRVHLAWRAVLFRYRAQGDGCTYGPFKHYARSCIGKLRQDARIDYRDL